jgi:hypothetical protein
MDFVGLYRDSARAFYYVWYSVRPEALALELPTGAIIHFRERDGLTFRSPQGVLSFRLQEGQLAGLSYTPKTIRADWVKLDR